MGLSMKAFRATSVGALRSKFCFRTSPRAKESCAAFTTRPRGKTIKHPGVVQISDVGKADDGSIFLVMEFLEGETLSERLCPRWSSSDQEAVTIGWQLADVLSAAHAKAIIHRDIRP